MVLICLQSFGHPQLTGAGSPLIYAVSIWICIHVAWPTSCVYRAFEFDLHRCKGFRNMFSEITVASQFCFAISARLTATSFGPLFAQCQATLSRRQSFRNDAQPPSIVYPVERADLSTRIGRPRACIRPTLFSRLTATSLGKEMSGYIESEAFFQQSCTEIGLLAVRHRLLCTSKFLRRRR